MRAWPLAAFTLVAFTGVLSAPDVRADEPPPPAPGNDGCPTQGDVILRLRTHDRPLPLLSGDPTRGFHLACSARWSTLSPGDQPLPIIGCFHGGLLEVKNETACGRNTGPLWVSSRWVVTRQDRAPQTDKPRVVCEQLETSALAATREFKADCVPRARELAPRSESTPPASAAAAAPAAAAAAPPPSREPAPH